MAISAKKRTTIAQVVEKVRGRACNGPQSWSSGPPRQAGVVCRSLERMTALGIMEDHNRLLHSTDDGSGVENVAMRSRCVLAATCVLVALGLLLWAGRESHAEQPAGHPNPPVPRTLTRRTTRRTAADRRACPQQSRSRPVSLRTRIPHRRPLNGLPTRVQPATNRRARPTPTIRRPQQSRSLRTGRRWIGGPYHGPSTNSPRGRALCQAGPLMVRESLRNRPAGRSPLSTSPSTRRGSTRRDIHRHPRSL